MLLIYSYNDNSYDNSSMIILMHACSSPMPGGWLVKTTLLTDFSYSCGSSDWEDIILR